jgi:hypothetical protein
MASYDATSGCFFGGQKLSVLLAISQIIGHQQNWIIGGIRNKLSINDNMLCCSGIPKSMVTTKLMVIIKFIGISD